MTAPFLRPLGADPASAPAAQASPARERLAKVEQYAADPSAARRAAHARGAQRPAHLVSTRARHQTAAIEQLFRLADGAVATALAVTLVLRARPEGLLMAPVRAVLPMAMGVVVLIWSLTAVRAYGVEHREALRSTMARLAASLLATAIALAVSEAICWPSLADWQAAETWFALSAAAISLSQTLWWMQVNRWRANGQLTPNIVVVGATANARKLIELASASGKLAVLGVFDDRLSRSPAEVAGVPVLGDAKALIGHRIMPYVDRVVITVPPQAQVRVRQLIETLKVLPNEVSLFLDLDDDDAQSAVLSRLAEAPMARLSGRGYDDRRILAKRLQDLILGVLALVLAIPVMALVALAVRLDSPGPVLFSQRRHGFNNEEIVVWKFRSMRHDRADLTASRQVVADDERVTRVGWFIRKFSLDELPQLFNVLKGEMSLVGPRPHAIGMRTGAVESAQLVAEYAWRHRIKPGVTGWAAIRGSRGPVHTRDEVRRRVELDIEYIERQSLWFDLYILVMTLPCLLLGDHEAVR
ncbi:MAG TPA: exopolysaccharide biosynthesis polyprenyl glycosylphosphotransferase [Caulobacteraceae bacterium]|nr:exopolysaccharide biosynthesis polyprenyl glycosylphosphotransferase [Caulobacteraceae bacterium]